MKTLLQAAKALSDPTRVRIFAALQQGELCVCELCDALGVSQSTLSTHLQLIRKAGLVRARREGKWMYYALPPETGHFVQLALDHFTSGLAKDPKIRADTARLQKRLAARKDGACCVGFSARCC